MNFNESDNYSAPACARGFWVLQCLTTARQPLTLEQLYQVSGVPKATLSRILDTLVQMEILHRHKDKSYEAMRQLTAVTNADIADFETTLKVEMTSLSKKCGHTVEWYEFSKNGMVLQHSVSPILERRVWAKEGYVRNWLGEVDAVYLVGKAFSPMPVAVNETPWRYETKGDRVILTDEDEADLIAKAKLKCCYADIMFNENGVRRGAVALSFLGKIRGVLAIAECWTPATDMHEINAISYLQLVKKRFD
ncbi:helix-turn-helix domain-containing protein [Photobacterium sp. DA100]|uniref:helix-turn-helix domain-containing protein n=1 Tax=Photobacterium sp. DA100 TaxID=3027472 RepID=UPI00247A17EE|nr:helix-turn-helix domain-containing protein [Photobacterium sp. DA100]WEM41169.1 helix-turn-helix domain-containing protein [Photobacterium sp. DA100]